MNHATQMTGSSPAQIGVFCGYLLVILSLLCCSKKPQESTKTKTSVAKSYGPTFLSVAALQVQDHSARGQSLSGVTDRARNILIDGNRRPKITIDPSSDAKLSVSIENQCTASQCYLLMTMEYTVPDPDGFNFRYRIGANAPLEGAKFEPTLEGLCAGLMKDLHLWRSALDMPESDLQKWLSFSDRGHLRAALMAAKDRGLHRLIPFIFRCFADPDGGPYIEAVHAAAALARPTDRSELKRIAISNDESRAKAAVKVLGISGLANRPDLKAIHEASHFESVRVEASFRLQEIGESSDTKSSDTTE